MRRTASLLIACYLLPVFFLPVAQGGSLHGHGPRPASQPPNQDSQVTVPNNPATPLYEGEPGTHESEIRFFPATRTVTLRLQVEDPSGYFLSNIRREDFAVYEDGVRQKNVTAEIEHAPISAALLLEFGGQYTELNRTLALEVPQIGRELLDVIGQDDKIAVLKYAAKVETLADFDQGHETLDGIFSQLATPTFSEANLYDALLETLHRMRDVRGRKAIIVVTTGLDTFSNANYQTVLQAAKDSGTPIYAIDLVHLVQEEITISRPNAPFARIDWSAVTKRLEALAKASGGRAYLLESDARLPAIYDDIMENLRMRYVITYVSSNTATSGGVRNIRVELIDPKTGGPLKIRDADGKLITAKVIVRDSYGPGTDSGN
jgi:Ca-activated chloride channel homolog